MQDRAVTQYVCNPVTADPPDTVPQVKSQPRDADPVVVHYVGYPRLQHPSRVADGTIEWMRSDIDHRYGLNDR